MLSVQRDNHQNISDVPRTASPHHLTRLAPSADRYCKSRPALSMLSRPKKPQELRWAPGTIDNERKARALPVMAVASNKSPPTRSSPNTSAKISPSRHRSPNCNPDRQTRRSSPHRKREISRTRLSRAIPPQVPDAPRPKPPPAPRPARLPTPDLPEIDGDFFAPVMEIGKKIVPSYSKMDAQRTFPPRTQNQ